jgi:HlyD family secretion protein
MNRVKRLLWPALFVLLVAAGLGYALWPRPLPADIAGIARGPLAVVVADDGETRVRDLYVVSAPLPGRVLRFGGKVGDAVRADETVLATIVPTDPAFLDPRARAQQQAVVSAAGAAKALAEAELRRQLAELDFARAEFRRTGELHQRGIVAQAARDRAEMEVRTHEAAVGTARAALRQREFELATARATLMIPTPEGHASAAKDSCCFAVKSPVAGRVLRVHQESEAVVAAGAPLVEVGDPGNLEIVVDLLSNEAVKVAPGDAARILRWGGPDALNGRVRRVEPFGRTKVSALGIEEQRVDVVIDFTDPPERWERLGHGYRVDVEIVVWQAADVLQVPIGAMFRQGDSWMVFAVRDGRAEPRRVEIGKVNDRVAEVRDGLKEGDRVIVNPSDRIGAGTLVIAR